MAIIIIKILRPIFWFPSEIPVSFLVGAVLSWGSTYFQFSWDLNHKHIHAQLILNSFLLGLVLYTSNGYDECILEQ